MVTPLAGSSSLAIPGTEGVCLGFYAPHNFLTQPRAYDPCISPGYARELRPGSAWALRAAIPWRFPELRGDAIVFTPHHGFGSVLGRFMPQSTQKAADRKASAALRFLSEPLRGHKSRASFPTVRANCVQAQPGPCGRRFSGDPRNGGGMPWFFTLALLRVKKMNSEK